MTTVSATVVFNARIRKQEKLRQIGANGSPFGILRDHQVLVSQGSVGRLAHKGSADLDVKRAFCRYRLQSNVVADRQSIDGFARRVDLLDRAVNQLNGEHRFRFRRFNR